MHRLFRLIILFSIFASLLNAAVPAQAQEGGEEAFIAGLLPAMVRLLDGFQVHYGRLAAESDPRLRELPGWLWIDHHGLRDGEPRTIPAAEVVPVRSVDHREIGDPGPMTKAIQEAYFKVVRGQDAEYDYWLERV